VRCSSVLPVCYAPLICLGNPPLGYVVESAAEWPRGCPDASKSPRPAKELSRSVVARLNLNIQIYNILIQKCFIGLEINKNFIYDWVQFEAIVSFITCHNMLSDHLSDNEKVLKETLTSLSSFDHVRGINEVEIQNAS
jgi:hypothetical protein